MQELVYLLKVAGTVQQGVSQKLRSNAPPSHVRLATLAPLSNYGFPSGSEGSLLALDSDGVVVGVEGSPDAPRLFVPWQNISYVADGTKAATDPRIRDQK